MNRKINGELNLKLKKDFRNEEIIEALNQMHAWKALDRDGLHVDLYQRFCERVGDDVTEMTLSFF